MQEKRITLIGGGVRTGKSALALEVANQSGRRGIYIATAEARDDEMRERVHHHQLERGERFDTIEEPLELAAVIAGLGPEDVAVVDCVTFWIANLLLRGDDEPAILTQVDAAIAALQASPASAVLVTNEVGMGIVPDNALSRTYRDVVGRTHQRLALTADEVYVAILGCMLRIKPGPVELVQPESRP